MMFFEKREKSYRKRFLALYYLNQSITNAPSIYKLEGMGYQVGGSVCSR